MELIKINFKSRHRSFMRTTSGTWQLYLRTDSSVSSMVYKLYFIRNKPRAWSLLHLEEAGRSILREVKHGEPELRTFRECKIVQNSDIWYSVLIAMLDNIGKIDK